MDRPMLVSDSVAEGQKIIEQLSQDGFEVTIAAWLKNLEDRQWYFYIVSPESESKGSNGGYFQLSKIIWQIPQLLWIDPLEIRLIGPNHPIAKEILAIRNRYPGPKSSPIRSRDYILGHTSFEEAFLYPISANTSP